MSVKSTSAPREAVSGGATASFQDPALSPLVCNVFEAARIIGYSVPWLAKARMTGEGPKFIKRPRKVLYEIAELHRWLSSQTKHSSTAEYARPASNASGVAA
jgi:hypothetical protein